MRWAGGGLRVGHVGWAASGMGMLAGFQNPMQVIPHIHHGRSVFARTRTCPTTLCDSLASHPGDVQARASLLASHIRAFPVLEWCTR